MDAEQLATFKAEILAEQRHTRQSVERLVYAIEGNGTPGLKTRIDRLERIAAGGAWLFGLVGGPVIVGVFLLLINWIRNGGRTE